MDSAPKPVVTSILVLVGSAKCLFYLGFRVYGYIHFWGSSGQNGN